MTTTNSPQSNDLEQRLERLETSSAPKPWFRQPSVIISIVALLLSLSATIYGEQRAGARDASTARDRLSGLIARLDALPKENASLIAQYADDPQTLANLGSSTQTELVVTSQQAADIISVIPDDVSGAEYYAVGAGLALAGNYGRAQAMFDTGLTRESDPQTQAAIWRTKASIYFGSGDLDRARTAMSQALSVFTSAGDSGSELQATYTEWQWSLGELFARRCSDAQVHLGRAREHLARTPASPVAQMYAGLVTQTESAAQECVP